MQISITAHLDALGIPPSVGGPIALAFTDIGKGASGWIGDPNGFDNTKVRPPGHLYPQGYTFLAAYAGEQFGYVFNSSGMNDEAFFKKLFFPAGVQTNRVNVAAILWLDPIFRDLKIRLGAGDEA
ncbi:hypothetical protein HK17_09705 [Acetobacter indonesiensis]|uniref:Uncharacterized protein n=2 Tax=Acetobacter indonesiensis TaxID=104101 RepID=A0A252ARZ6_9PROT|nr:hypothetical protein HK17_09705 [Acetobacter indonesiensis]